MTVEVANRVMTIRMFCDDYLVETSGVTHVNGTVDESSESTSYLSLVA
jgi:hypothetical protein